jgi:hypothetical protein
MKRITAGLLLLTLLAPHARGVVYISEVFINPPGGLDSNHEFIELTGTPGKKLDGYAIAFLNGTERKFYNLGSIPPVPNPRPEIDEFFSLDGLALGPNGILVLRRGPLSAYPTILSDSNHVDRDTLWTGFLDTPGNLQNDGSNTIMLVRNRPGATEATHPTPPAIDLRWGKDISHDVGLFSPVIDPQDGLPKDQWGNGAIDKKTVTTNGLQMLDLRGAETPADLTDDLEVVDEVSYEHTRGWEYDLDNRTVDSNSLAPGLPERNVHALDDIQGFNPDSLTRVDYRTKGPGYPPASGAVGALPNGNNWQDTATEQWIRGESVEDLDINFDSIFFYSNAANADSNAIQPFLTQVPLWLDDMTGDDFDFAQTNTYQIMAGRVNPLAVPFVPGDSDRDGDCDADDIAKIAAVFGDADWIFSNSFADAPEGKNGDPATQTRPWDVDATGDNGIEAGDLQWTLNFQGSTDGRIQGLQYDDPTPAASGVVLNPNTGTACTVSAGTNVPSGRPLNDLRFGDVVEITVSAAVTAGANLSAGEENGIMQFVHDVAISAGGTLQVTEIAKLGTFTTTRATLETLNGNAGDEGVSLINGYTTGFTSGLGSADPLYRVTTRIIGPGTVDVDITAAGAVRFAASAPQGLKLGHTDNHGDPASASYPATITVTGGIPGDDDGDGDVDVQDWLNFPACMTGPGGGLLNGCGVFDFDIDDDVDLNDYARFQQAAS